MSALLSMTPDHWSWWLLAIVLVVVEVFAPGFFFLWLGVAAALVGLALYLAPDLSWQTQVIAFAVLSIASILGWRTWFRRRPEPSDHPNLNRRAAQYVGRVFVLVEPIANGRGRIRVDDASWTVEGADAPAGARVRVTGVKDAVLQVIPEPGPEGGAA